MSTIPTILYLNSKIQQKTRYKYYWHSSLTMRKYQYILIFCLLCAFDHSQKALYSIPTNSDKSPLINDLSYEFMKSLNND